MGVKRFKDRKEERFLSQQELVNLGKVMDNALEDGENPYSIAIIKLLIFTGARKNEIESLTWSEVNFKMGYLNLSDSKTGQKIIPLNAGALTIFNELKHYHESQYIFPASRGASYYVGTPKV